MLGIGGLAHDIGFPMMAGVLSTLVMWAGPAQVLLFGSIAAGAALPAIALAVCFSSIRFMPMTVALLPLLRGPGIGYWRLLLASHLIAVTNYSEGIRKLPHMPESSRYPYFLGFGLTTLTTSTIVTGIGYSLTGKLPPFLAGALLFMTPMFFTVSLSAGARGLVDWAALALGMVLVPVATMVVGPDFDLLVGGVIAGSLAYGLRRLRRREAA